MADKKKIDDGVLLAVRNEIRMATEFNKRELQPILEESIARYVGWFVPGFGEDWDILVNEIYPVVQNYLPSIFFRTPRALLKPRQKSYIAKRRNPSNGKMEETQLDSAKSASTQEAILNYSVSEEMDYKKQVRSTLLDSLIYPYGVLWHGYKGNFGMTEERSFWIKDDKVFVKRISPMRFIHDPSVTLTNLDEAKWVGRVIDVPLNDLIEDDELDVDKSKIKGFDGFGQKVGGGKGRSVAKSQGGVDTQSLFPTPKTLFEFTDDTFQRNNAAKFVQVFEIYMRPTKKEARKGSKGTILLLTDEQEKPLRVSDWTIKAEGFPAHILFFNEVPDSLLPLGDIDIYKQIADQKNVIFNLQLRNAQENSKVWVGISSEGADEEDVEAVRQGDNTIIKFETGNPRDRMFVASAGGTASSELYIIDQRIQKNLEDKTGLTDLRRGFLQSGEESAESVRVRESGGAVRIAYRQDIMADFLKGSFKYINQLNRQFKSVDEAVRIVGKLDVDWVDNISKEELQAEVDVDINVFSMLPENPERELRSLNTVLALMVQAIQSPEIRTKILQEGKTINLSPLIEQILNRLKIKEPDLFRNIKPEESQGFVSVQQLREAQQNVDAVLNGQPAPAPPSPNDDHRAKLEVYTAMQQILEKLGQVSQGLNQLIQVQQLLLQQTQEQGANPPQAIKLKKPTLETV